MEQKFKPILFSTEMVQAILAGRKTQTRRTTVDWDQHKPKYIISGQGMYGDKYPKPSKYMAHFRYPNEGTDSVGLVSPIQPGDILWVRETFKVAAWNSEENKVSFYYKASPGENFPMVIYDDSDKFETLWEKTISELDKLGEGDVDNEECTVTYNFPAGDNPLNWKPSLFMPKEAARIFLKVTDVRCERLLDISSADCILEGIEYEGNILDSPTFRDYSIKNKKHFNVGLSFTSFITLWKSINGEESSRNNPFVWVYTFEKIEKPINF